MALLKLAVLYAVTATAEIGGCYMAWLVLTRHRSCWLLLLFLSRESCSFLVPFNYHCSSWLEK